MIPGRQLAQPVAPRRDPLRILLIDDSRADATLVMRAFPATWLHVESIAAASAALEAGRFDCIVTDLNLSDAFGIQAVRTLRSVAPHAPLLILSGHLSDALVAELVAAGADSVLGKNALQMLARAIALALAQRLRLQQSTCTDELTSLPNRAALALRFEELRKRARRARTNGSGKARIAVLFFDLDRFKQINDTFGHRAGDEVIQVVATRAKETLREVDMLGRIHGDEFVAVADGIDTVVDALTLANRVLEGTAGAVRLQKTVVCTISLSIGCAVYPEHGKTFDQLVASADQAMLEAKRMGRGCVRVSQKSVCDVCDEE